MGGVKGEEMGTIEKPEWLAVLGQKYMGRSREDGIGKAAWSSGKDKRPIVTRAAGLVDSVQPDCENQKTLGWRHDASV